MFIKFTSWRNVFHIQNYAFPEDAKLLNFIYFTLKAPVWIHIGLWVDITTFFLKIAVLLSVYSCS